MVITLLPHQEKALEAALKAGVIHSVEEFVDSAIAHLPLSVAAPPNKRETLHEFLMNSPLRGANLDLERSKDYPRTVDLE